jgi:hypothetical protein
MPEIRDFDEIRAAEVPLLWLKHEKTTVFRLIFRYRGNLTSAI